MHKESYDVILVNTPHFDGKSTINLGLLTIASYLREHGVKVSILDGEEKDIRSALISIDLSNSIIGFTAVTHVVDTAYELCKWVKAMSPKSLCVIGGIHATTLPERTLREGTFDLAVIGEGERTMLEIVEFYNSGSDGIYQIAGTAYLKNDGFHNNPPRPLMKELDGIPFPAFDLIEMDKHWGFIRTMGVNARKTLYLLISRGCPFECSFCSSNLIWHKKIRWHSTNYVIELINKLVTTYQIDSIAFLDDELCSNKRRLFELTTKFRETGLAKKIVWECQSTVTSFDEERAHMLTTAGCKLVRFGLESGSQKTLDYLKGPRFRLESSIKALATAKKAGLNTFGSFIIGAPDETLSDILETVEFIQHSCLDGVAIYVATPYPGTRLWNDSVENGYIVHDFSWRDFVVEATSVMKVEPFYHSKHFTGVQLFQIRDYIEKHIAAPINAGKMPKEYNHKVEIEKILAGNLKALEDTLLDKFSYYSGRIKNAIKNPNKIVPYILKNWIQI